jgi:hypothetical protein
MYVIKMVSYKLSKRAPHQSPHYNEKHALLVSLLRNRALTGSSFFSKTGTKQGSLPCRSIMETGTKQGQKGGIATLTGISGCLFMNRALTGNRNRDRIGPNLDPYSIPIAKLA